MSILVENKVFFTISRAASLVEWLEDVNVTFYLKSAECKSDIFMFWDRLPTINAQRSSKFVSERDNIAGLQLVSYDFWFQHQIGKKTRNMIRKAHKEGVETKVCVVDDSIIRNVEYVYNHSLPMRQGVPFGHYGEKFDQIKRSFESNSKYSRKFIGAFYKGKMIGFTCLFFSKGNDSAVIGQILSIEQFWNKAPNNALIARAVEVACAYKTKYLVYTKMYSERETSENSLRNFKKRNGFCEMTVMRHYVALTQKGKLVLSLKLHHGFRGILPRRIKDLVYSKRSTAVKFRLGLIHVIRRVSGFSRQLRHKSKEKANPTGRAILPCLYHILLEGKAMFQAEERLEQKNAGCSL